MKVVLMPSGVDGSGCYRVLLPGRELREQRCWDARMAPNNGDIGRGRTLQYRGVRGGQSVPMDEWLLTEPFDVLVWQQRGEPWPRRLSEELRAQGKQVLVDSDDAWWGLPAWNPGSTRLPTDVESMRNQLRVADGLSVATPALADLYRRCQPNVRVIRNYLDWRMWDHVEPVYELERRKVRVGWMGDARWRAGDIDVLAPWLGEWLARHPEVEFVAAGDTTGLVHDHVGTPAGQRVCTAPVEFYNFDLADITATFDIGLVPLKVDDPKSALLNECKSHLKGMEYAACGIPCIATPTESYRHWVEPGVNGFLASTPDQWVAALDSLLEDDLWRRMGRWARAKAKRNTLQEHIGEWEAWIAGSGAHPQPSGARTPAHAGVG